MIHHSRLALVLLLFECALSVAAKAQLISDSRLAFEARPSLTSAALTAPGVRSAVTVSLSIDARAVATLRLTQSPSIRPRPDQQPPPHVPAGQSAVMPRVTTISLGSHGTLTFTPPGADVGPGRGGATRLQLPRKP